jgi:hypothetical protein
LPYGLNVRLSSEGRLNLDSEYVNEHANKIGPIRSYGVYQANGKFDVSGEFYVTEKYSFDFESISEIEILLRPLSQLTEAIEHGGERFVPIVRIAEMLGMRQVSPYDADDEGVIYYGWEHTSCDSSEQYLFSYYEDGKFGVWIDEVSGRPLYSEFSLEVIQFMHSIHVDLYGLIEAGLAEAITSIPQP